MNNREINWLRLSPSRPTYPLPLIPYLFARFRRPIRPRFGPGTSADSPPAPPSNPRPAPGPLSLRPLRFSPYSPAFGT
jgi:hypothetical protein